jgi:hypothetical protein
MRLPILRCYFEYGTTIQNFNQSFGGIHMPITPEFRAEVEEAQRLRGWITNSYAQIEFLLGDLIIRMRSFPIYKSETSVFTHSASKRIVKIKQMLEKDGPLNPFKSELADAIGIFQASQEIRNLLAHGYCTFLYTPDGDTGLLFQKWHRHNERDDAQLVRLFRIDDLIREKEQLANFAQDTMQIFVRIHAHFGWIKDQH